jgi:CRISPR-associated protein Cmr2
MPELLLIGLGPVQDFIAAARRCQDLWFGSFLLSELSRAAAKAVGAGDPGNVAFIFPPSVNEENVANKILCRVPKGRSKELAELSYRAVVQKLSELADDAYAGLPEAGGLFKRDVADAQLEDLLEWQWVSVPFEVDSDYKVARARVEDLFARSKFLRAWRQPPWNPIAGVPKSSVDGARESVLDESIYGKQGAPTPPQVLRQKYGVGKGERLCGVGLLKRRGADKADALGPNDAPRWQTPAFHSTSHIAAGPVLTRIHNHPEGATLVRKYLKSLEKGWDGLSLSLQRVTIRASSLSEKDADTITLTDPVSGKSARVDRVLNSSKNDRRGVDGVVLFEDRLPALLDEALESGQNDLISDERRARWVEQARRSLAELLEELECPTPTPYYALLLADGDRMGKALDRLSTMDQHREVSTRLESFAKQCGATVESFGGSLLYSGGDDVLAMVPLHTALQCARKLADDFKDVLAGTPAAGPDGPEGEKPTLSVGLAIAHHMEPLSDVRELAKDAEKLAKKARNSLALMVQKRSGGCLSVSRPWSDPESLDKVLWDWVNALQGNDMPDSAAFELDRAVTVFEAERDARNDECPDTRRAVLALVRRALKRRGEATQTKGPLERIGTRIDVIKNSDQNALHAVRELSTELQIAREFHAAWRVAWADSGSGGDR